MRVCPKCGYREPDIWLHHQFQQHVDYTRIEDFEREYPELARAMLKAGHVTSDKYYYYRRTKKGAPFIHRWSKAYGPRGFHLDYEKAPFKEKVDRNQKKLLETT